MTIVGHHQYPSQPPRRQKEGTPQQTEKERPQVSDSTSKVLTVDVPGPTGEEIVISRAEYEALVRAVVKGQWAGRYRRLLTGEMATGSSDKEVESLVRHARATFEEAGLTSKLEQVIALARDESRRELKRNVSHETAQKLDDILSFGTQVAQETVACARVALNTADDKVPREKVLDYVHSQIMSTRAADASDDPNSANSQRQGKRRR